MAISYELQQGIVDRAVQSHLTAKKAAGEDIDPAHDWNPHLQNVSRLAPIFARILGFPARVQFLSGIPGATHDLTRFKGEDSKVSDEAIAAAETRALLEKPILNGEMDITPYEMDAIASAIEQHSKAPAWLFDPNKRNQIPKLLSDQLYLALFEADHIEANGPYLVARRSQFVGGTRMIPSDDPKIAGDLYTTGFRKGDELLVISMEGVIRQTLRNPKTMQPDVLKPTLDPLYTTQEAYFIGSCKAGGFTLEQLAENIFSNNMATGNRNIINPPLTPQELVAQFSQTTGITNETIQQAKPELADSSAEAINFFSHSPRANLIELIRSWKPRNSTSQLWHQQMLEYVNGDWVKALSAKYPANYE